MENTVGLVRWMANNMGLLLVPKPCHNQGNVSLHI